MLSNSSSGARLGLVAAAFVVAAVLGAAILNNSRSSEVGGTAPPTPTPVVSPSVGPAATPGVAEEVTTLEAGTYVPCDATDTGKACLKPGTYQLTGGLDVWPATVTADVPAGWFEWEGGTGWDAVLVNGGADENYAGSGWGVMFTTVGAVRRDPCDGSKGMIPAAQVDTPEKLAAAIAAWPNFTETAPQAVTVDGHSGLEFTLSRTTETGCGSGTSWTTASNATVDAYPFADGKKYRTIVRIVDTERGLLVIRANDFPDASPFELQGGLAQSATRHAADLPELQAILDSVRIVDPAPSPSS